MDRAIKFNKIYLIHSIPNGEYSLTRQLETRVLPEIQGFSTHIKFDSFECNTAEDINDVLDVITEETRTSGILPLIQFDMHGTEGYFQTKVGIRIYFKDISYKISIINRLSRFNLLLLIVACEGASFIAEIMPTKPSPCWGIVSSTRPFLNVDASNFIDVYRKVAAEEREWSTIDTLNNEVSKGTRFSVFTSEEIFKKAFKFYIEYHTGDAEITSRSASIQEKKGRGYAVLTEYIRDKGAIADINSAFNDCKRIFFMVDDLPENAVRFPLIVHDIYDVPTIGVSDQDDNQ